MNGKSPVEAVVVAHDSGDYLKECVASLVAQMAPERVVIVDTESSDGSVEAVTTEWSGVRRLDVPNKGFAFANNRGIEQTSADAVLLLNPDAQAGPGMTDRLLRYLEDHPDVGIVAPLVVDPDGSPQYGAWGRFPSLAESIRLALARLSRKVMARSRSPERPAEPFDVDWVTGAAMMVRREAIAKVGGMDEGFFLYYEDVDWCKRMKSAGWRVVVVPDVVAFHHSGKSGAGSGSPAYRKSFVRYAKKHRLPGLLLIGGAAARLRRLLGGRG